MRFKSIQTLLTDTRLVLERFPWVLASAVLSTLSVIILSNQSYEAQKNLSYLTHLSIIAALGIPLFLSFKVCLEAHNEDKKIFPFLSLLGFIVLLIYYLVLPKHLKGFDINRYALININAHLLVAVAPFLFLPNGSNSFWQYNKALFLRFILSFIYSNTIFVGIAIAIGVTDYLFEFIKFDEKIYMHLWLAVVGIFNTWFFLGGVPKDVRVLDGDKRYPRGLKIFTQFVLIPLVLLYLGILYLYMSKIIVTWELPTGWLSSFIIGVSMFGILTLLLVHPLTDQEENAWFRIYRRYFYLALFPLIILMAVAIGRRVMDYGLTEQRYFVLVFTVWLFFIAVKFTLKPNTNIRSIPLTLMVLIAVATWGPWNAMAVSKRSQMARLKHILVQNGLLKDKLLHASSQPLKNADTREISNIVYYLQNNFGLQILEDWVISTEFWKDLSANDFVTKKLGLEYVGGYSYSRFGGSGNNDIRFNFYTGQNLAAIKVSGYDYYVPFSIYGVQNKSREMMAKITLPQEGRILEIAINQDTGLLSVRWGGKEFPVVEFSQTWIKEIREKRGFQSYDLPLEELTFETEAKPTRFKIMIQNISGTISDENMPPTLTAIRGSVLISSDE